MGTCAHILGRMFSLWDIPVSHIVVKVSWNVQIATFRIQVPTQVSQYVSSVGLRGEEGPFWTATWFSRCILVLISTLLRSTWLQPFAINIELLHLHSQKRCELVYAIAVDALEIPSVCTSWYEDYPISQGFSRISYLSTAYSWIFWAIQQCLTSCFTSFYGDKPWPNLPRSSKLEDQGSTTCWVTRSLLMALVRRQSFMGYLGSKSQQFGSQNIRPPWKIHSTFEVFFTSRERYESNFLGPLTAGFGNGSFWYQSWGFTSLKKERKKASSDDSISINHPSLFQIGRNSPRNPFLSHQHDPLQSPSVAGSQEDEPPDVETSVTWQRFGKPLKLVKSPGPRW